MNILPPISKEQRDFVDTLQNHCYSIYCNVGSSLKAGMSEVDIENILKKKFAKYQITSYWYTVPVFVFIGERYMDMIEEDYDKKRPQIGQKLRSGQIVHIDMHPQYSHTDPNKTWWGNFAGTFIWRPKPQSEKSVQFLNFIQSVQKTVISHIGPTTRAADVAQYILETFKKDNIQLTDVIGTAGHNMGYGQKSSFNRSYIKPDNDTLLQGQIWGIEPGGYRSIKDGEYARFETCIYVPETGKAAILGKQDLLPVIFK